jgi:pimeloyl-ACP methyl ester carboxylesterase
MSEAHRPRRTLRRIGAVFTGLLAILVILYLSLYIVANRALNRTDIDAKQKTVTSKDGTLVAFEQTGAGPVVIPVTGALADRRGTRWLAKHLAEHFTVINYDRRGRGKSTDTQPYAVEHEVENIEVLIDATGGSAFGFGVSSGAVLALEAASELGGKVQKLFLYEPPIIVDDSRPPMPADFGNQITEMVSEGHPSDAVKLFFTKGMGIPPLAVTMMRLLMPGWSKMTGMAHTLAILSGTQEGQPLPVKRWAATTAPTLVVVGGQSEAFFHHGAQALTETLPIAQYRSLEGRDHAAVLMAPKAIADAMQQFFLIGR